MTSLLFLDVSEQRAVFCGVIIVWNYTVVHKIEQNHKASLSVSFLHCTDMFLVVSYCYFVLLRGFNRPKAILFWTGKEMYTVGKSQDTMEECLEISM